MERSMRAIAFEADEFTGLLKRTTEPIREIESEDVILKVLHCGISIADLHLIQNEIENPNFNGIPGRDVVGKVLKKGKAVNNFQLGDTVGVLSSDLCGGLSSHMVVNQKHLVKIPEGQDAEEVAALLNSGTTVYSALKFLCLTDDTDVRNGKQIAICGLSDEGHVALQMCRSLGHNVTIISKSAFSRKDALDKLKANDFIFLKDRKTMQSKMNSYDYIFDTVQSLEHLENYVQLLKTNGCLVIIGALNPVPMQFICPSLIFGRKSILGSLSGTTKEAEEMLGRWADKGLKCMIERVNATEDDINDAMEKLQVGFGKYKFVIDFSQM